jgi:hypothetical protein
VTAEYPLLNGLLDGRKVKSESPQTSERFGRAGGAPWLIRSQQDFCDLIYTWGHEERELRMICRTNPLWSMAASIVNETLSCEFMILDPDGVLGSLVDHLVVSRRVLCQICWR